MRPPRIVFVAYLSMLPGAAWAQTAAPPVRGDVVGLLGWLNANKSEHDAYNDWYTRSVYGGLGIGWHLAEHVRVEVDGGATSAVELYRVQPTPTESGVAYVGSRTRVSTRRATVGLQYQFFENAWFHPHVGVGADATWERVRQEVEPMFLFDGSAREPRLVRPGRTVDDETIQKTRSFASTGFKAYVTPRAFVRSDVRVLIRGRIDEVLLRVGVGVDF